MSKKIRRIITDDLDLEDKQGKTADSFYGEGGKAKGLDSAAPGKAYTGKKRFFAVLSTSDKAINNRLYDKDSWKKTVTDGAWTGPIYSKPMLRNHDLYSDIPFGRIKDSFFVEHSNMTVVNKDNKGLDEKVLNHFKDLGVFQDGSGTVIVEFSSDEATAQRMIAGLDCTVSQSSFFGKATCTICGNDYYSMECSHVAGRNYPRRNDKDEPIEDRYCLVQAKDFDPIELSIVNIPANDTSVIYVLDETSAPKPNPEPSSGDSLEGKNHENGGKIDDNKKPCNDNDNNTKKKPEDNEIMKGLLKDTLNEKIKKEISDSPEFTENFNKVFDALATDEDVKAMKDFLSSIVTVIEGRIEDSKKIAEAETPVNTTDAGTTGEDGQSEDGSKEGEKQPEATVNGTDAQAKVEEEAQKLLGDTQEETTETTQARTFDSPIIKAQINGLKL